MADLSNVVKILITAEDKATAEIQNVGKSINDTLSEAKVNTENVKKVMNFEEAIPGIKKVSDELLKIGAAGMGVVGAVSFLGLELNKSVAAAGSVAGATAEQMKQLENLAREVGKTTIVSAKDAADAMYYLASAGMKTQEIMTALPSVTNLAASTFSDMALASQAVVNALSQYQLGVDQAQKVSDVFVTAISNSQASLQKLVDSMKYAGPVASAFNISLQETVAAMMLFYNAGLSGEQAGTALRNILLSLADPSREAADELKKVGISLEEINPSKHNLQEIAKRFAEAGITAEQLSTIVGKEAVAAMLTLMQNANELPKLKQMLDQSTGAAKNLADQMANTPYGQYQQAINQLKEMAYSAFPAVFEAIKVLTKPLMDMVNWFNSLSDSTKEGIAQFIAYGSAVALLVGGIGKAIVTFSELNKAMKAIQAIDFVGTMKNWQGAIAGFSTSAVGQIAAISGVVGLLIYDVTKAIELFKTLKDLAQIKQETKQIKREADISETVVNIQKQILSIDKSAFEDLVATAKQLVQKGIAKNMAEAQLITIATDTSGALGSLLQRRPDLRQLAHKVLFEYDVKVRLDTSDFDYEWRKLGDRLKQRIADEVARAGW